MVAFGSPLSLDYTLALVISEWRGKTQDTEILPIQQQKKVISTMPRY